MDENNFRILILGDFAVGKTSFMFRYLDDIFNPFTLSSIGIDLRIKELERNNEKIFLKIFDTAGQERFHSLVINYYKGADGIILIYDISNLDTFKSIKNWIEGINENINIKEIGFIIVGNKCDLPEDEKKVTDEMKKNLENSLNIKIIEASAKNNINVNESFEKLVDKMMELKKNKEHINSLKLKEEKDINNKNENEGKCCGSKKIKDKDIQ